MPKSPVSRFNCPNCDASYMVVQVRAAPSTLYCQITCRSCDSPLEAQRGGSFSNISFSRSAAKAPQSLAANISADVVLLCYSTTVRSTNSKISAAMQATVIIAPTITTALVRRHRHGRVFACARIASSRSASHPTNSVSI